MRSYNVNLELYDEAVMKEYRIIQRFFDMGEAEEFKEQFKYKRSKILNGTITPEDLLRIAELIKIHCD